MKKLFQLLAAVLCAHCALAQDSITAELNRIAAMNAALDGGGIDGFLDQARREAWRVPHIPSQWHVEHVSKPEEKPVDVASRAFGKAVALRLSDESAMMQQMPAEEPLFAATVRLLDLSEWCSSLEGYGNAFLAQRCLDLAAVGVARLSADLDFPIQKVDRLLGRMEPAWMSPEANLRILNKDAGAVIFTTPDREEMERIYGSGYRLLAEQRDPALVENRKKSPYKWQLIESPEIRDNLAFFDRLEAGQLGPRTLVNTWDQKLHSAFVVGLGLQTIGKARALVEFRKRIGAFPEKVVFTAEELRDRERGRTEAAKAGLKITNMEDTYASPMAAAFAQAWRRYLESETSNIGNLPQQRQNLDSAAFQAYSEVRQGKFLDQDSQQTALNTRR
jgi:hypothetical protein